MKLVPVHHSLGQFVLIDKKLKEFLQENNLSMSGSSDYISIFIYPLSNKNTVVSICGNGISVYDNKYINDMVRLAERYEEYNLNASIEVIYTKSLPTETENK